MKTHLATVMAYIKFTKYLQLFLWVNKFILILHKEKIDAYGYMF